MTLSKPASPLLRILVALPSLSLAAAILRAQESSESAAPNEQVVQMSAFEVTTTQGHGYVTTNATSGMKTNTNLLDIPQSITVVTRDLIDDLGYYNSTGIVQYFGLSAGFEGESMQMRGKGVGYAFVDDMSENQPYEDNVIVDSYEIIKGPAQVLYVNGLSSGTVVKSTKKPLPFPQRIVTLSIDNYGLFRATVDFTGPIGHLGSVAVAYRLVSAYQAGGSYFYNVKEKRRVLFPGLKFDYKNTMVRLAFDFQSIYHIPDGLSILDIPSGNLYTGAGRRESDILSGDMEHHEERRLSMEVLQKFSDSWEMRLEGSHWDYTRFGPLARPTGYNWTNKTITYTSDQNNQFLNYWNFLADAVGHWEIGPVKNEDAFGVAYSDWTVKAENWTTSSFGTQTIALNSAALNAVVIPPPTAFPPPANEGTDVRTSLSNFYAQHTLDAIPDRLFFVGGFSWAGISTVNVSNISLLPWQSTYVPATTWLHRIGAVLKLTKEVSVYSMESTTFTPPPGSSSLLLSGQLPPPQAGKDREIGMKTALMGGKISTNFAWFHIVTTNITQIGGQFPNGVNFVIPVGTTVQEGVDGDFDLALVPGWQMITSFYAGHDRDQNNNPVSGSYDNSWSVLSRYDFQPGTVLHGLDLGVGVVRKSEGWITTGGLSGATGILTPYQVLTGQIKMHPGTLLNAFAAYHWNKHWIFHANIDNILNEAYPIGAQTIYETDPSPPITFSFEVEFRF